LIAEVAKVARQPSLQPIFNYLFLILIWAYIWAFFDWFSPWNFYTTYAMGKNFNTIKCSRDPFLMLRFVFFSVRS
jgi:hypothetical protein